MKSSLFNKLSSLAHRVKSNELLGRHTTFGIGGPADYYIEPSNDKELFSVVHIVREEALPLLIIGQGSNLLVSDGGFRGVVLRLRGDFDAVEIKSDEMKTGAATRLPHVIKCSAQAALAGTEILVGVPGTVGGALITNAGTSEGSIGPLVERVEFIGNEGRIETWERNQLSFSYRNSNLGGKILLSAVLQLKSGDKREIDRRIGALMERRSKTQPLGTFNVGCIFKNPPGKFAARLIEEAGMKGFQKGGAKVSEQHSNFIVNLDSASSRDVEQIIREIRHVVMDRFGIELELEIKLVEEKGIKNEPIFFA